MAHGGVDGGYTLYVKDKKLHYVHNYVAAEEFHVESVEEIPEGHVELRYEFEPTGKPDIKVGKGSPGRGQLYINKELVGQIEMPYTVPLCLGLGAGITVGRKDGSPITDDYKVPFPFTGTLHQVTVDVSGDLIHDEEAAMRAIMARQ
jgi:arylsulfatase